MDHFIYFVVSGHDDVEIALEKENDMNLKGKKIVVVGAGRSGIAVSRFCAQKGACVQLNDRRNFGEFEGPWADLKNLGIDLKGGGHLSEELANADLIVLSPGVPGSLPEFTRAKNNNVPIMGELELASRFNRAPLIAVTGTNGKSTTTTLVHHLLQAGGKKAGMAGNIGIPLIELVETRENYEVIVIEVSSFQLETIEKLHPVIALILNISEDHLDRYDSFQDYCLAKARLFMNQTREDYLVFNKEDKIVSDMIVSAQGISIPFSSEAELTQGIYYKGSQIVYNRADHLLERYDLSDVKLKGLHNIENMMAAIVAARIFSVSPQDIQKGLNSFVGLEHRLEWVREHNGVSYYNDSKATNVHAVIMSLRGFQDHEVLLIAGGYDKGGSYETLKPWLKKKVKRLFLVGKAQKKMKLAFEGVVPTECVETIDRALKEAQPHSRRGDSVVLSPACASFDQFKNFEERGRFFKECVCHLQ